MPVNLATVLLIAGLGAGMSHTLPAAIQHEGCPVLVEIVEGIPDRPNWDFEASSPTHSFHTPAVALLDVPEKYSEKGLVIDRSNRYLVRVSGQFHLQPGAYRFLLRSRNAARLRIDGKIVAETPFVVPNQSSHDRLPVVNRVAEPGAPPLPAGHSECIEHVNVDKGSIDLRLEAIVGGKGLRAELGQLIVCVGREGEPLKLMSSTVDIPFQVDRWNRFSRDHYERLQDMESNDRLAKQTDHLRYWRRRHRLVREYCERNWRPAIVASLGEPVQPNAIDQLVQQRLRSLGVSPAPLTDDDPFLRRVFLDTVGLVPALDDIQRFYQDESEQRRTRVIDRLLQHPSWADNWMGYWQDVLAENPALLKPKLNNTGPFRWWIHRSLRDNKPMDRFATELVMMQGSKYGGGPAGFSVATQNDVPMVTKAHVLAKAFLGVEMQCARCHDAPSHPVRQEQLFGLGAMLARKPLTVPPTSSVDFSGRTRDPTVEVTLKPGSSVTADWPFPELIDSDPELDLHLIQLQSTDDRERFAAYLTSPRNRRFPRVIVNRLWKRLLGYGIVEPVDDWHDSENRYPQLLDYLAYELVTNAYDLKHVTRLILNSETYQRSIHRGSHSPTEEQDVFAAPRRRRMTAEQVVDSLFHIAGKPLNTEPLCLDPEGRRPITQFLNLGVPQRAWQFTSMSNDRDRPSLSLPFAQNIVDVLISLGWREARQHPVTERESTTTPLQPMMLANSVVGRRIATLSDDGDLTKLCLMDQSLDELIDSVSLAILSRPPRDDEREMFTNLLEAGYQTRIQKDVPLNFPKPVPVTGVSWANHFDAESVRVKQRLAIEAAKGDPPTQRLESDWRERMEDMIWCLVQSPEFLFLP